MIDFDYINLNNMLDSFKPMEYKPYRPYQEKYKEILAEGKYMDYHFVIVSYGTHPCAYVEIPEDHPYFGHSYYNDDINVNLPVHGGITWAECFSPALQDKLVPGERRWFLGWDYNHAGDYSSFNGPFSLFDGVFGMSGGCFTENKKWSTLEIFTEDVCPAIEELIKIKYESCSEKTND